MLPSFSPDPDVVQRPVLDETQLLSSACSVTMRAGAEVCGFLLGVASDPVPVHDSHNMILEVCDDLFFGASLP